MSVVAVALAAAMVAAGGSALGFTTPTTTTTTVPLGLVAETATTTTTTTTTTIAPPSTTTTTQPSFAAVTAPVATVTTALPLAAATTTTEPASDDVPIGQIDTSGAVPPGLDLAALPGAPAAPPVAGDVDFSAGPGCAYQCISSGVAYPRGFGVELVVETRVPADLVLIVARDGDGDGSYEFTEHLDSSGRVTRFSAALDHLARGATYYVTVAATDELGDISYAFGQFTTLSERTVNLVVGDVDIIGGPTNIVHTDTVFIIDGDYWDIDGAGWELVHVGLDRRVDLALRVYREWQVAGSTLCEGSYPETDPPTGNSDDRCETWNTASLNDLDVDVIPPNRAHWTSVGFERTLVTPSGAGGQLPPGYGEPRYFDISASISFVVTYS
ncbi:hypothetical protein [Desertimonas flava]|uniref:hypothetical protein n=1 Tax=Desertimonas flava TaxID=2064846 RepID=UPI001877F11C|nr:hypothetical protein [Desertimonas flava]